jgi:flagellar biogenesis protein FliO
VTTIIVWAIAAALVAAGVAILRARKARGGGEAIRLVTSRYLGAKRFLTIVEVDGERLLLGLAGEQVSLVARLGSAHDEDPACEDRP